jgi:hypothetical protein
MSNDEIMQKHPYFPMDNGDGTADMCYNHRDVEMMLDEARKDEAAKFLTWLVLNQFDWVYENGDYHFQISGEPAKFEEVYNQFKEETK